MARSWAYIRRSAPLQRWVPIACLLVFFALALGTALSKAPTVDEPVHLLRGRTLWQIRELSLQDQHPPLSHWLIGSLLFTDPDMPDVTRLESWPTHDRPAIAHEFLWQSGLDVGRVILLARFPIILVALLLGAMLARWARELSGRDAQNVVLLLFAFSPNLVAFASLATTDISTCATYVAAVFSWWRYWRRPCRERWFWAAVCLGLALSAKLTALLLLPLTLILCYSQWQRSRPWWRPGMIWLSILPITGLVLWALYGFEFRPADGLSFPLPAATYLDNVLRLQDHITGGHRAYLLGKLSQHGWWHYFGVALLIKTPLPTLLLTVAAAIGCLRQGNGQKEVFLWLPAAALFTVASYTRLNIGYRHILPVLPFLLVWGASVAPAWLRTNATRGMLVLLVIWYLIGTLRQHPHHVAYFNELIGRPGRAYRYLGDSNLDWGQDIKLLADYVSQHQTDVVHVAYFGSADLSYYGLDQLSLLDEDGAATGLAAANPAAGLYAISASHLQGVSLAEPDLFDWFRHQEPIDQVGRSILVYDVPEQAPGRWIAHCLDPAPLLDQTAASHLVGQTDLRHLYFNCRSSWVFAQGGQPGWYLLPQAKDIWPLLGLVSEESPTSYSHSATVSAPSFEIHYWPGGRASSELALATTASHITLQDGSRVQPPIALGDTAQLVGYRSEELAWWTVWQVLKPASEPLSVAAHLFVGESSPIVADGLGFTSDQWNTDDLLIQLHSFPSSTGAEFLETGLYNYLTGERLMVTGGDSRGDRVRLFPTHDLE